MRVSNNYYRILLIKPKKDKAYIRKVNNWMFDLFKALCIVNKDNIVTEVAIDASHGVQKVQVLDDYLKKVLGKTRFEKLKPDEHLRYWVVKESVKLDPAYELSKPVRGIRYATYEEEKNIEKIIVKSWFNNFNLTYHDVFWNTNGYPQVYGTCMGYDFQNTLFELEKTGELYK